MIDLSRRLFALALPVFLGGCASDLMRRPAFRFPQRGAYADAYGETEDDGFLIPAVAPGEIDPAFLRRKVSYAGREAPGTIIVDPNNRYLHLVEGGGRAIRYGVVVGREGFAWSGVAAI